MIITEIQLIKNKYVQTTTTIWTIYYNILYKTLKHFIQITPTIRTIHYNFLY